MSRILHDHPTPLEGTPTAVRILRSEPPGLQTYHVPLVEPVSILGLLRIIQEQFDATLAFRNQECNQGICGVCRMKIDFAPQQQQDSVRVRKACRIMVQPGATVTIQPSSPDKVIRDLVCEF
jgi:succinate dehydrogenase/fumarate reductase-like Fe-S protein